MVFGVPKLLQMFECTFLWPYLTDSVLYHFASRTTTYFLAWKKEISRTRLKTVWQTCSIYNAVKTISDVLLDRRMHIRWYWHRFRLFSNTITRFNDGTKLLTILSRMGINFNKLEVKVKGDVLQLRLNKFYLQPGVTNSISWHVCDLR